MRQLLIQQGEGEKGRVFRAAILACVQAQCWDAGIGAPSIRPAYLMLGCSEGEAGPVLANLRMGRKASAQGIETAWKQKDEIELLKSAGYEFAQQRHAIGAKGEQTGVVIQAYLPDLFRIDPGFVDPDRVRFCMLPRLADLADPSLDIAGAVEHIRRLGWIEPPREYYRGGGPTEAEVIEVVPYAPLFGAYLNARTRCPLVPDLAFLVQVLCAFLHHGLAHRAKGDRSGWGRSDDRRGGYVQEVGLADVGLAPGLVMNARADEVEGRLAAETAAYFAVKEGRNVRHLSYRTEF